MTKVLRRNELRGAASEWLKRALRESEGPTHGRWTISALAMKARVARATVWRILEQKTDPTPETILALAAALQLPIPPPWDVLAGLEGDDASWTPGARTPNPHPGARLDVGQLGQLPERQAARMLENELAEAAAETLSACPGGPARLVLATYLERVALRFSERWNTGGRIARLARKLKAEEAP